MTPEFKCSGPAPAKGRLEKYRAAQKRALALLGELGYPICMGLTFDADKLAKELRAAIKLMADNTSRERSELTDKGEFK